MTTLHLMTQRGQPYGSVRRCCEECGTAVLVPPNYGTFTDQPETYRAPPDGYVSCKATPFTRKAGEP